MTKLNVHLITNNSIEPLNILADQAIRKFSKSNDIEIVSHGQISNQLDLAKTLMVIERSNTKSIIFHTITDISLNTYLKNFCDLHSIDQVDVITPFLISISNSLEYDIPLAHEPDNIYFKKIDAINFADRYDDGKKVDGIFYADILIIGISRTSKTPLSLYLANQSYRVVNIPLLPESDTPSELFEIDPKKIFGLTDNVENISKRRKERLHSLGLPENSDYASKERILTEISYAHGIMKEIGCPIIDVSNKAIEEIADIIIRHISK